MTREQILQVVGVALWILLQWALQQRKKRQEGGQPGEASETAEDLGATRKDLAERLRRAADRCRSVATDAAALESSLATVRGPVAVLRRATRAHVITPAETLAPKLDSLAQVVETASDGASIRAAAAQAERAAAEHPPGLLAARLHVLSAAAEQRRDPVQARLIEDADAVADDLLAPLRAFAERETGNPLRERPICVPSDGEDESVWMGLLPDHPVIVVPPDLGRRLPRWAALPHEIGHVLFTRWPGYEDEVRSVLELERAGRLPFLADDGQVAFHPDEALAAWLEEMHADAFACLVFGPAALRGAIACFARPDQPAAVLRAYADGQQFAPHPPAHLRVLWSAWLLERMAFEHEPRALLAAWEEIHGRPEHVQLPLGQRNVLNVPVAYMFERGVERLERWYETQWQAFQGYTLSDIPELEMGPGLWSRTRRVAASLAAGRPVADRPRIVLAAAVEAWGQRPGAAEVIAAATRDSIVGLESDDRRKAPRPTAVVAPSGAFTAAELRDALILREVLAPRRRHV